MTTLEDARDVPEALAVARILESYVKNFGDHPSGCRPRAAAELRRLHAEVEALRGGWIPGGNPPPESAGEVFVKFTNGEIGTGWPTYWHGSCSDFAQWMHPDPDDDRKVAYWMKPLPTPPAQEDGN